MTSGRQHSISQTNKLKGQEKRKQKEEKKKDTDISVYWMKIRERRLSRSYRTVQHHRRLCCTAARWVKERWGVAGPVETTKHRLPLKAHRGWHLWLQTFFCQVKLGLFSSVLCWTGLRYQSSAVVLGTVAPQWWILPLLVYGGSAVASSYWPSCVVNISSALRCNSKAVTVQMSLGSSDFLRISGRSLRWSFWIWRQQQDGGGSGLFWTKRHFNLIHSNFSSVQ